MDSLLSFPVGLFHPLQHAGLSRRTRFTDLPGVEARMGKYWALLGSGSLIRYESVSSGAPAARWRSSAGVGVVAWRAVAPCVRPLSEWRAAQRR
jgi:hypothetical protein